MSSSSKHKLLNILKDMYKQVECLSLIDTSLYNSYIHLKNGCTAVFRTDSWHTEESPPPFPIGSSLLRISLHFPSQSSTPNPQTLAFTSHPSLTSIHPGWSQMAEPSVNGSVGDEGECSPEGKPQPRPRPPKPHRLVYSTAFSSSSKPC